MEYKKKINIIKLSLIVLGTGVIVFLFFYISPQKPKRIEGEFRLGSKLAFGKGISFIEYHRDQKVYFVSIDSYYIERARIGPFAISPLHILYLNNVDIDLYYEGIKSKLESEIKEDEIQKIEKSEEILNFDQIFSDMRKKMPSEAKKLKGIEIHKISINLWKEGERIFRISSDSATIDRKTKDLIFSGKANLDAGINGRIISHRIRWDKKTHLFKIMDPFYLIRNGKKIEGKGIETDYLLKKISYIPSSK